MSLLEVVEKQEREDSVLVDAVVAGASARATLRRQDVLLRNVPIAEWISQVEHQGLILLQRTAKKITIRGRRSDAASIMRKERRSGHVLLTSSVALQIQL